MLNFPKLICHQGSNCDNKCQVNQLLLEYFI